MDAVLAAVGADPSANGRVARDAFVEAVAPHVPRASPSPSKRQRSPRLRSPLRSPRRHAKPQRMESVVFGGDI